MISCDFFAGLLVTFYSDYEISDREAQKLSQCWQKLVQFCQKLLQFCQMLLRKFCNFSKVPQSDQISVFLVTEGFKVCVPKCNLAH